MQQSLVDQPCCLIFASSVRLMMFISHTNSPGRPCSVLCEQTRLFCQKDPVNPYMNIAFRLVVVLPGFAWVVFVGCLGGSERQICIGH